MNTQNGCSLATFLIEKESPNTYAISKQNWRWWQAMVPQPVPLPCALTFPSPSHRDATTPSPCWAPHFMTQERIMFLNPTPSKLRLSPTAMMSDDTLSALTLPLHFASILQPAAPPQVVAFESQTISASNLSHSFHLCCITEIRSLNLCVCFHLYLFCLCFCERWTSASSPCVQFGRHHHCDSTITFTIV